MELGIFSRTYNAADIDAVFLKIRNAGLKYTQLNLTSAGLPSLPEIVDDRKIEAIIGAAQRHGIHISALSGTFNMIQPDNESRRRACEQFALQCRIARQLNAPIVTLCTGSRNADKWRWDEDNLSDAAWNDLLHSTESILRHAQNNRVVLGVETEASNIINTPRRALRYLRCFENPYLGIIMDGANIFQSGDLNRQHEIMDEAFELLGNHIVLAHAKDLRDGSPLRFDGPGLGGLDFDYYLKKLHGSGYQGAIIMHGMSESAAESCASFMKSKLKGLNLYAAKKD